MASVKQSKKTRKKPAIGSKSTLLDIGRVHPPKTRLLDVFPTITILYRPSSDHEREVLEFHKRLQDNQVEAELVNVDSRDGIATASLYDIVRYPAVLALEMDGRPIQTWSGQLPMLQEVSYYAHV